MALAIIVTPSMFAGEPRSWIDQRGDGDDDRMLWIMIRENAGQADAHFGFILEAVSAIMMQVAYDELVAMGKPMANITRTTLGALLSGKGVGNEAIAEHCAIDGQISTDHIKVALNLIKSSDKHLALMRQVQKRVIADGNAEAISRAEKMRSRGWMRPGHAQPAGMS